VRSLSEVNGDAQFARGYGKSVDMVLMLVRDDDGVEGGRILAGKLHAPAELAAAQPCIHEDPRMAARHNRAVAFGPRRQHGEAHHPLRIPRGAVHRSYDGLTQVERGGWKVGGRAAHTKKDVRSQPLGRILAT